MPEPVAIDEQVASTARGPEAPSAASELQTITIEAQPPPNSAETALVLSAKAPLPAGTDSPVDSESVGSELENLRSLLVTLEDQFYDPDKLLLLLLPAVTEAIRDRLKQRSSAIASVLRSEMSIPIEEQIAVERDAIIDALYPVIGSTLAEYFIETLRTINSRVAGNSVDGVKPVEDDLPVAAGPIVQGLFLIHRSTGLLLAQAVNNNQLINTAERRSELLTAIRSAANTHLQQPQSLSQTGQYRQGQIFVELAEPCYLAALVQGDPPVSFLRHMGHLLKAITVDHGELLATFEGDTSAVPEAIAHRLRRLLHRHTGSGANRSKRWIGLGLLLLGGIAASIWGLQEWRDRRLVAIATQVERTAELLNQGSGVAITAATEDNQVILEGDVLQFNSMADIRAAFNQIEGVETVIDRVNTQPLTIPIEIYFYPNSTSISPRDIANKIVSVVELLGQYPDFNLKVIGYQNPVDEATASDLALDRSLAVADALADQGIARDRLEVVEATGTPPGVNVERQPWLSRAVLFELVPLQPGPQ